MSRRKQTNPNKVHWEQVIAGLEEQARQAMMKTEFSRQFAQQHPSLQQPADQDVSSSDSEVDEETTVDEISSPASEEDGTLMKVKKEPEIASAGRCEEQEVIDGFNVHVLAGIYQCSLCHLDCFSREQLITHVYQHTAAVMSSKRYMCPVCGRALSSPGSLGRHLLIHSQDQMSNCAVCGAHFTSHATFNSEKLPEVLNPETWNQNNSESSSSTDTKQADLSAVYPAGILLVCNNCAAYRKLLEVQTSTVRKWAIRRQNEPLEVRLQRLERERTAKKSRRDSESAEERELRRLRDREAKRLQRMQETDEQRSRRLQRDREAMRVKRANETPEKRQARLIREREAKRLKRRLEKMDMMLHAQFGQDSAAMAALAAEMNFFQLPVGGTDLDTQLLNKMAFEEQANSMLQ
ncbi:zinc finger protein 821 isoform X2 [Microcaecilia unicolor]|uniref:Zinc finger protein 821 isoform X2 n=1 Tax=Microcaecilia unicolor TaxID=1415580 RepID=A0A6P7Y6F3_9AMPH|nr:zinc finger protein 821 isoform X2 [Microcaecilia unicolor]XP_030060538.1 zinc finger protein 821 isoform X2 [Microcaecilia unicolor]